MGLINSPNIITSGLVANYDGANIRSFRGEPTTNLSRNSRNLSGTAYASDDEWVSSEPTRLTKTYVSTINTPVGTGATHIQESGTAGFHHLSRYGGGSESGAHSISCYIFPVTSDITDFTIGMLGDGSNSIFFNLNTRQITYGGGISNRNAFIEDVSGWPGWLRVGANIEGRVGGWVGCIGYSSHTSYTGTAGNKRCYITGVQYEYTSAPTFFIDAQQTRGTTNATGGGWVDLSGNAKHGELLNGPTYNSDKGGSIVFDGSNDYISLGNVGTIGNQQTIDVWFYSTSVTNYKNVLDMNYANYGSTGNVGPRLEQYSDGTSNWIWSGNTGNNNLYNYQSVQYSLSANTWYNATWVCDNGTVAVYLNGTATQTGISSSNGFLTTYGAASIGRGFHLDSSRYFAGRVGGVKIYSKVLSATEILQNFNATRDRYGV